VRNGSGHTGLCNGLSRMKGNFHVRFLGEGVVATPLPYPTQRQIKRLNRCQSSRRAVSRWLILVQDHDSEGTGLG